MNHRALKTPSKQKINDLLALYQAKNYSEAISKAQKLTKHFPEHGLGWNVLGLSYLFTGKTEQALRPLQKLATLAPNDAAVRSNLGNVLRDLGRLPEAEASYRTALKIDPRYVTALINLGALLMSMKRFEESENCYRNALQITPSAAAVHRGLGNVLRSMGRLGDALKCYQTALSIEPNSAITYCDCGSALWLDGQVQKAIEHYRLSLKFDPYSVASHNDLAVALLKSGKWAECASHCQVAIRLDPSVYQPYVNLGNALSELGQYAEAETSYRNALKLNPNLAEAHSNLGNVLLKQGRIIEAESCCKTALTIAPHFTEAFMNLGNVYKDLGQLIEAENCYHKVMHLDPYHANAFGDLLFSLNYRETKPDYIFELARQFGIEASFKTPDRFTEWAIEPAPRRLRIGFVSGDLGYHPVGYFLEGLLAELDQQTLELYAYTTSSKNDELSGRIRTHFSSWKSIQGLNDEDAAQLIYDDGIHILIDLSGHTAKNRLPVFAWKPAPVQVSWLGYFATTGLPEMDYLIADHWTLPKSEEIYFTENIWRLPDTRLCFTPPIEDIDVSPLPALNNRRITFGCFNNLNKMNEAVVALWARVLKAVPDSRLFIKSRQLGDAALQQQTLARFAAHDIPAERLTLEGADPRSAYLVAYQRVDIALDPFPFTGGTTSVEGLWMGVPVLTLAGERFLSRQGVGILMNAGLEDWIAKDADDYVARAVSHASNVERLSDLRQKLRQQVLTSPLFDATRFARNFEAAMRGMWQRFEEQPTSKAQSLLYKINKTNQNRVVIISATQLNEAEFWEKSALGRSLPHHLKQDARLSASIAFANTQGLPEIFNQAIDQAEDQDMLVFMHDDVWIDEVHSLADVVIEGLAHFDVLGVAGNRRRVQGQPAWGFIDGNLTPDNPINLSGRIAHGEKPFGKVSYFGETPAECELLDGVFIAAKKISLSSNKVHFDPQFDFHFYDLDFCRSARRAGLKLGTWQIKLTHQSGGNYRSAHWREKSQLYLSKWDQADARKRQK